MQLLAFSVTDLIISGAAFFTPLSWSQNGTVAHPLARPQIHNKKTPPIGQEPFPILTHVNYVKYEYAKWYFISSVK